MGVYKREKIWYIDFYANGRRIRERVGPNKRMAETALKKREVQVAENRFLEIRGKTEKITFTVMAESYLKTYSEPNKKSAWRDQISINHLTSYFGKKFLHEITPEDVEKYKAKRRKEVSGSTVNRELACLKHIFTKAVKWKKVKKNPTLEVKLFKESGKRVRYLEKEDIVRLCESCSDWLRPIVLTALNTGMRRNEILNLKWRDIDFRRRIIYITDSKVGKREVPLNDLLFKVLLRVRKNEKSPYIFCHKNGKPRKDIRDSFKLGLKRAGIKDFHFHDLRHTFASHLVMSGVDLKTVQELLGHRTIEMTLRYSHLSPDHKRAAVNALGNRIVTSWSQALGGEDESDFSGILESGIDEDLKDSKLVAGVAESVDALDSKSSGAYPHVGSTPTSGTLPPKLCLF